MKVIVAGSRVFNDYQYLQTCCDLMAEEWVPDLVVCGMAKGADLAGRKWAKARGIEVKEMPADWNTEPRLAGFLRNVEMSKVADAAIVFWDGHSNGSAHMIRVMREAGKPVIVVKF